MCGINPEQYAEYRRKQSEQIPPEQIRLYSAGTIDRYQTAGAGQKRSTAGHMPDTAPTECRRRDPEQIPRYMSRTDTAEAIDRSADKLTAGTIANRDTAPGKYRRNSHPRPERPRPRPASTAETARKSLTAPAGSSAPGMG